MKRLGNISQAVETLQNFREAFFDFSRHKKSRLSVQAFEAEFETNLQALLNAYVNQTWHTSDYEAKPVEKPKHRIVNKLPVGDHVIQHAAMHTSEDKLRAKIPFNSPAGTKGRGTHFFYKIIKQDIYTSPQLETFYCLPMDIHHYFQHVEHNLLKREYRLYIKDRKLLAFIDEVVDSYANGIVLGVKHIVTKKVPKDRLAIRFRFIDHVRKTGQLDEHGDEIEEPVWQPESWWLFTGSDILVDQARKEWELLEKGFYTVAAELTNKFGKKFYKFI